jgi:hypothetical protein
VPLLFFALSDCFTSDGFAHPWVTHETVFEGNVMDRFPEEVARNLKWYVYRLIDPRNGETFYVGKGKGNRVFEHVKGAESFSGEDASDLKYQRIKAIKAAGLEVAHVIHRHNIDSADVAFQIEAALIDAYAGLANRVGGHGSGDYGCRHVEEIVAEYLAQPFEAKEPLILISIAKSYEEEGKDIYKAVRGVWVLDAKKAQRYKLVLAHRRGIVLGAFRPGRWLPGTRVNFSWLDEDMPDRFGFEGQRAEEEVETYYTKTNRRVPDELRRRGAANPVRYVDPAAMSSRVIGG